jgi:hypothetical protein
MLSFPVNHYIKRPSWNITGNSATNPSTNFIGTTDNKAFVFKTNNKEQMRILATGQIGIGVKNPLQKLHCEWQHQY